MESVNIFAPCTHTLLIVCSGQVTGVAVASAIFQSLLDRELRKRITGDGAGDVSVVLSYVWNSADEVIIRRFGVFGTRLAWWPVYLSSCSSTHVNHMALLFVACFYMQHAQPG